MSRSVQSVREPAVAGTFYPGSPGALRAAVQRFVEEAYASGRGPGAAKAIVAPHAGYAYSGPIAGSAFASLAARAGSITRVVVIGPAHRVALEGLAWPAAAVLRTPLGDLEVDTDAVSAVPGLAASAQAHAREHSVEVELPFVQVVLPRARVVPLVVGRARPEEVEAVLAALWGGEETAIVVSSDLSHYLPYDEGRAVDTATSAHVLALDATPLEGDQACGAAGINGLVRVARARGMRAELVDLRSSGDTAGPRGEVVGYGAFAFHETSRSPAR